MAAKQKYSPLGHWDVSLQQRKKPQGTWRAITSSYQTTQIRNWDHGTTGVKFCQKPPKPHRANLTEHQSTFKAARLLLSSHLRIRPLPRSTRGHRGALCAFLLCWHPQHPGQDRTWSNGNGQRDCRWTPSVVPHCRAVAPYLLKRVQEKYTRHAQATGGCRTHLWTH